MTIKKYAKKRNFKKTPEPDGKKQKTKGESVFAVQKHAARRLHYDLRLEHGGVLKSWAVPKGPTLDPKIKRLAMMVEDHPYDYKDFEGVIPEGNYGAGRVIVWDAGTFLSEGAKNKKENETNVARGLRRGDLKFELFGKKLKGNFALVKIKKDAEGKSWLLIKKDDSAARQPIKEIDFSVRTGKKLEEIDESLNVKNILAEARKEFGRSMKKEKLPLLIKPMTARLTDQAFSKKGWLFEIKWDGFRALGISQKDKSRLISRNGLSFNDRFSPVWQSLKNIKARAIFDGEIVSLDAKGRPVFQFVQNWHEEKQGTLAYKVFDILHLEGYNLRNLPLGGRKKIVEKILAIAEAPYFQYVDHIDEKGQEFFDQSSQAGLEGIIAKKSDSPYLSGKRSDHWLKIKRINVQDAVIGGYTEPRGGRKNLGALILGVYEKGQLRYIGHAGGGFDEKKLAEIKKKLSKIERKRSPFGVTPKTNSPPHWVAPKFVAEVKFSEWSRDGLLRQPIFLRLRDDKDPKDVIKEI